MYLRTTLALLLALTLPLLAAAPDDRQEADQQLLKEAGLTTDGPALLDYFRQRTVSAAVRQKVADLIRQLGNDDFDVREQATRGLIALGPASEPALLRAATDTDAEIASRAQHCLESRKDKLSGPETHAAAARLLVAAKVPQTVEALLDYLPSACDEQLEEEIVRLLVPLGVADGKLHSALAAVVDDPLPVRRLAAAGLLARAGSEHRTAARKMLADADARVRLFAAQSLLGVQDKTGVPTLIALLGDGPLNIVWPAEDQLYRVAGAKAPPAALDPGDALSRKQARAAWDAWWKTHADTIDLTKLPAQSRLLGLTIICDFDGGPTAQGRVYECSADGTQRWSIDNVQGPADVQVLPSGRILIAEHNGSRVSERSRDGKVVWEHRVMGNPVSCQRLANGNTFIATYTELLEVTRDGKPVYSIAKPYGIYCAQKLPNGNILYIHSTSQIVELETSDREVRTIHAGNTAGWASVELLPSGRFLVSLYNVGKVKEIDVNGRVYLDCAAPQSTFATRLANGHTLATDTQNRKVIEFDQLGKAVWKQDVTGRPFRVRRR